MSTLADLIVTDLQRAGVRAVFGVPGGGSNLDLIEAAGRAGRDAKRSAASEMWIQTFHPGHPLFER